MLFCPPKIDLLCGKSSDLRLVVNCKNNISLRKMKKNLTFIALFLLSCNHKGTKNPTTKNDSLNIQTYSNKSNYSIEIGDTIAIYHSTNSCCKYCQPNADKLRHLQYIGSKIVVPEKKGCEGCNHTSAVLFVAKSAGIDTIKDALIHPGSECKDTIKGLSNYIVRIR